MLRTEGDEAVSDVHASIGWIGTNWCLRDRGSKNGTYLNGARVVDRVDHPLTVDDVIGIGSQRWVVEDVEPPGLLLVADDGSEPIHVPALIGLAVLPSTEDPRVLVVRTATGLWLAETEGDSWTLTTGSELRIHDRLHRVEVPEPHAATAEHGSNPSPNSLAQARVEVAVSHREEEADLTIEIGGRLFRVVDRIPLYLLVLLARARTGAIAGSDASGEGWIGVKEVCRQLGILNEGLNLHVFRVRECIQKLGIDDANSIIERRRGIMRIGVDPTRLRIVKRS